MTFFKILKGKKVLLHTEPKNIGFCQITSYKGKIWVSIIKYENLRIKIEFFLLAASFGEQQVKERLFSSGGGGRMVMMTIVLRF